ncbi:hypothetical protein BYT27DRAFT_6431952 [Phlegmacium glaucopus]|nr:hypothetical protein BYT27DRAFT_6431952 [Phlegmacium glaucopus]
MASRSSTTAQPLCAHPTIAVETFLMFYIKDWKPHVLSPTEIQHFREHTHLGIRNIRDLEATQFQMMPKRSLQLEQSLSMARMDYRIRFGRIFRINDFPPEVLTNIFRYVIWSAVGPELGIRWRLWLTWVCGHWREITLNDPLLWNDIWFEDLPNFERSLTWLERSANAPLDVRINDRKGGPISVPTLHNLLKRLFDKISNIRKIVIIFQEWDPILVVLDAFRVVQKRGCPMILEQFEMHRSGLGTGYKPSYKPIPLFGGATVPSLKNLTLNRVNIDWTTSVLTNLTALHLRQLPLQKASTLVQFPALLGRSPALQILFLDGAGHGWSNIITRGLEPVHIPSLRMLSLKNFTVQHATDVCAQIFAPNVVYLTLTNLAGEDYWRLYDRLRSNMPKIKVLALHNFDFVPGPRLSMSIFNWLQSMPLLTFLRIGTVKSQFLELFLHNCQTMSSLAEPQEPSEHIPCPKLAFLDVVEIGAQNGIDVIARWACIRRQLGYPLQNLYLSADIAKQLGQYQRRQLAAALGSVDAICVVPVGNRPMEGVLREDIH